MGTNECGLTLYILIITHFIGIKLQKVIAVTTYDQAFKMTWYYIYVHGRMDFNQRLC